MILTPKKPFALKKPAQLQVNGVPPGGLQDGLGRFIDGNHDGQAGGNAVFVINRKAKSVSSLALNASKATTALRETVASIDPAGAGAWKLKLK